MNANRLDLQALRRRVFKDCGGWPGIAALLGVAGLVLEFGFHKPVLPVWLLASLQWVALLGFAIALLDRVRCDGLSRVTMRRHGGHVVFFALLYALLMLRDHPLVLMRALAAGYVGIHWLWRRMTHVAGLAGERLERGSKPLRPDKLLVGSFAAAILFGGLLLLLPRATTTQIDTYVADHPFGHIINCFFTATSATCVTGLAVYDTSTDFTRFGQVVILVLIQLGGLGIMVSGSLFGMLTGRKLSLRESLVLQDALSHQTIGQLRGMIRFIVVSTLLFELFGAVLLYTMWPAEMPSFSERVFHSVFHAVSAFCNAGFALHTDSLVGFRGCWQVYTIIMPLIVIGGLGFPVLSEIKARWQRRRSGRSRHQRSWTLHSRFVLIATPSLIIVPAIIMYALESIGSPTSVVGDQIALSELNWFERAWAVLFRSITTRTAGFNVTTLSSDAQSTGTTFLMCVLMFIGGSPASTAGGVKTVAIFVLGVGVWSTLRRRPHVEFAHRAIPDTIVRRAATVVFVMFAIVTTVTLLLCCTESASLDEVLFESVSACGTVGLTLGLTPKLTLTGRVVIMAAMFAGRLGPLSILLALAGRESTARYTYPEEQVVIG